MRKILIPSAMTAALTLAGCATPIPYSGETITGEALRADITRKVLMLGRLTSKCPTIDNIGTQVVNLDTTPADDPQKPPQLKSAVEHWTLTRCGERHTYEVLLSPAREGGTVYTIRQLTQARATRPLESMRTPTPQKPASDDTDERL